MTSKAVRLARGTALFVGAAVMLAVVLGVGTTALAANGKPFLLGKPNVATAVSTLVNRGVGPALSLNVKAGQPPLAVNSRAKVVNLNADRVDGLDSTAFQRSGTKATDSDKLDGKDSADFLGADQKAADATHADRADIATNASNAANADTLDGRNSSDFAPGSAEAWHEVGASGEPGFQSGFSNYRDVSTANWSTAAFYKDPYGVVHLKGTVKSGSDLIGGSPVFTLPSDYRPSAIERHAVFKNIGVFSEQAVSVDIKPDGSVSVGGGRYDNGLSLDGITFRAAGR